MSNEVADFMVMDTPCNVVVQPCRDYDRPSSGLEVKGRGGLVNDWPELTIGEVARKAGVATSSIRYYESIGLLPAPARLHGQRRYGTDVLGRLAFIGVAQSAGFKLTEIKDLVDGVDGTDGMASQMRALSSRKLEEVTALL